VTEHRYAFPKQEKEPIDDAAHVRNAIARFDQVEGVSDEDRDDAWKRIQAAAKKYGIEVEASSWHELMKGGHSRS
jgi:cell division protein FtsX